MHRFAVLHLSGEDHLSQRVLQRTLDHPLERSRAIRGVVAEPCNLGDEQLAWAADVLAQNSKVRWTIIFIHKPMWRYGAEANWSKVEELLGDRPRTVFAGHHHRYAVHKQGEWTYYALATTGGGSKLEGPAEGRFDHVVWVTMTPEGPRLANLLLDGILSEDPIAEATAGK